MPLTNEDIISALVSYYKRTGVDMTSLLGDPTFQAMKVADKIEAVKTYAKDIHAGSTNDLTDTERKGVAATAIANAWPILPAVAMIAMQGPIAGVLPGVKGKALLAAGLGSAAIGLASGAMKGYLQARSARVYRENLRRNLQNVVENPSTTNAVGVLATSNVRANRFSLGDAIGNTALSELNKMDPTERLEEFFPQQLAARNKYEQAARDLRAAQSAYPK